MFEIKCLKCGHKSKLSIEDTVRVFVDSDGIEIDTVSGDDVTFIIIECAKCGNKLEGLT